MSESMKKRSKSSSSSSKGGSGKAPTKSARSNHDYSGSKHARPRAGGSYKTSTVNQSLAMRGMIENVKGIDTLITIPKVKSDMGDNSSAFGLTLINQGNGSFNRKDQKAILRSMRLRGLVIGHFLNSALGQEAEANFVRICVVLCTKAGDSIPKFSDVFGGVDAQGAESCPDIMHGVRLDKTAEYKLLRDIRLPLNNDVPLEVREPPTAIRQTCVFIDEFVSLAGIETTYSATAASNAAPAWSEQSTNPIVVYVRCRHNGTESWASVELNNRLRFY